MIKHVAVVMAVIASLGSVASASEVDAHCRGQISKRDGSGSDKKANFKFTYSTDAKGATGTYEVAPVTIIEDEKYRAYLGTSNWGETFTIFVVEKTKDPKEMTSLGLGNAKHLARSSDSSNGNSPKYANVDYFNDEVFISVACQDLL